MTRVAPSVLASLCAARWQGNVRELENVLERALITSPGDELRIQPLKSVGSALARPRVETFHDASRRAIMAALEATGSKIYGQDGAAQLLRLKPSTLQTKMEKLGVKR